VKQSIPVEHQIERYDNITDIINETEGPIAIMQCICRERSRVKGLPCQQTKLTETCMSFGDMARNLIRFGTAREINKDEALGICQQCEADGLVLQPSNTQKVEFVCACCGCCCQILSVHKMLAKPLDFWATNYYAEIDREKCTGCGTCEHRCQVNAIHVQPKTGISTIDLTLCIGCGNCISVCPVRAISLNKRKQETIPPIDHEHLYDSIKANRQGTLGKLKLATRFVMCFGLD